MDKYNTIEQKSDGELSHSHWLRKVAATNSKPKKKEPRKKKQKQKLLLFQSTTKGEMNSCTSYHPMSVNEIDSVRTRVAREHCHCIGSSLGKERATTRYFFKRASNVSPLFV